MKSNPVEQAKLNYKLSLVDKAERLMKLKEQAAKDLEPLSQFLHQLSGSAGMYGYDDVFNLSTDVHRSIKQNKNHDFDAQIAELHRLLIHHAK